MVEFEITPMFFPNVVTQMGMRSTKAKSDKKPHESLSYLITLHRISNI